MICEFNELISANKTKVIQLKVRAICALVISILILFFVNTYVTFKKFISYHYLRLGSWNYYYCQMQYSGIDRAAINLFYF